MDVRLGDEIVKILCCPEDVFCVGTARHDSNVCCEKCRAPICKECMTHVRPSKSSPTVPPAALSNDMMIYHAPIEFYANGVTMLEMFCSSVCITSMICFTLGKRLGTLGVLMKQCMLILFEWLLEVMQLLFLCHGRTC